MFDVREPGQPGVEQVKLRASQMELLCLDWNKYQPFSLATSGVDRVIRTWDLRNPGMPVTELRGHEYAVRKIAWSPHWADVLLSASYDMTVRVWSDGSLGASGGGMGGPGMGAMGGPGQAAQAQGAGRMLGVMDRHTEFCAGVDWCLFGGEGWAASTGWDEMVWVWDVGGVIGSR